MYPSIFNRLRAIAIGQKLQLFLPLAFKPRGLPIGIPGKNLVIRKLESFYQDLTDRRTAYINNVR